MIFRANRRLSSWQWRLYEMKTANQKGSRNEEEKVIYLRTTETTAGVDPGQNLQPYDRPKRIARTNQSSRTSTSAKERRQHNNNKSANRRQQTKIFLTKSPIYIVVAFIGGLLSILNVCLTRYADTNDAASYERYTFSTLRRLKKHIWQPIIWVKRD